MTHVCVLSGGNGDEREVSLRSGRAVGAALEQAGYRVTILDGKDSPNELLAMLKQKHDIDVVFSVLHGKEGEDGMFDGFLDPFIVPYVGGGSQECFVKTIYREILAENHLPIAAGETVSKLAHSSRPTLEESRFSKKPFVLKPFDSGSSIDTFIIRDVANAPMEKMKETLRRRKHMLIEELVEGTEITVGVLGNQALTPIEIIPPAGSEFDYENKYNGATRELCPPEHVSAAAQQAAGKLAVQIHQLLKCRHYSRTDMIVRSDDSIVVLETNTLPGMTDQSLFPKAAAASGISMPELCDRLVQMALH